MVDMSTSKVSERSITGKAAAQTSLPDISASSDFEGPVPSSIMVDTTMTTPLHSTATPTQPHILSSSTIVMDSSSSPTPVSSPTSLTFDTSSPLVPVAASTSSSPTPHASSSGPGLGTAKLTMIIVIPVVIVVIIAPIFLIWLIMRRRRQRNNQVWHSPTEKAMLSSRDQSPKRPPKRGDPFRKPWEKSHRSKRHHLTFSGFDFDFPPPRSTRSSISTRSPRCVTRNEHREKSPDSTSGDTPPPPYPAALKPKIRFGLTKDLNRTPLPDLPRDAKPDIQDSPLTYPRYPRGRTRSSSLIPPPPQEPQSNIQTNQQGTNAWLNSYPYPLSRSLTVRSLSLEDIPSPSAANNMYTTCRQSASSPVLTDISGMSFDPSMWVGLYDRTAPASPGEPDGKMAMNPRHMI